MKKNFSLLLVIAVIAAVLCSCGDQYADRLAEDQVPSKKVELNSLTESLSDKSSVEQKLIKRYSIYLESLKYDESKSALEALVKEYGGYFSSSNESAYQNSGRYGRYSIRIPSAKVDNFVGELSSVGNITRKSLDSDDVTESYYSTKSKLESLKLQEERILAMIEQAKDLDTLIKLEDKLASIRSSISELDYTMQYYDKAVDYSFVELSLDEVIEYTEDEDDSFWSDLKYALSQTFVVFAKAVRGFLIAVVWILPFVIFFGIIAVIVIVIEVKRRKKSKKKNDGDTEK